MCWVSLAVRRRGRAFQIPFLKLLKALETCTQWLNLLRRLEAGTWKMSTTSSAREVLREPTSQAVPKQACPSSVCHHSEGSPPWMHQQGCWADLMLGSCGGWAHVVAFGHSLFQGLLEQQLAREGTHLYLSYQPDPLHKERFPSRGEEKLLLAWQFALRNRCLGV